MAPTWALEIEKDVDNTRDPNDLPFAWEWRQLDTWVQGIAALPKPREIQLKIEALTNDRQRVRPEPMYVAVFLSTARGQMRQDSDIDILVVRPASTDDNDDVWDEQVAELGRLVTRWTGNDGRILQMTEPEVATGAASDPLLGAIASEGLTVHGPPEWLRTVVRRFRVQRAANQ